MGAIDRTSAGLCAQVLSVGALAHADRDAMYDLFARYYGGAARAQFDADLAAKYATVLLTAGDRVVGFSTIGRSRHDHKGQPVEAVFSGDTVVEREYWGEQLLSQALLGEFGRLAATIAPVPLYWLMIVMSQRTYRVMTTFAHHSVPRADTAADDPVLSLRDRIALDLFGTDYDRATGIVRFAAAQGNLIEQYAEPTERELRLKHVAYFHQANPGFRQGDELACLCRLTPDNLRKVPRRWFEQGMARSG